MCNGVNNGVKSVGISSIRTKGFVKRKVETGNRITGNLADNVADDTDFNNERQVDVAVVVATSSCHRENKEKHIPVVVAT